MKQIVLQEPGHFEMVQTQPELQLGPDEAMLKVHRIGICGTDLHAFAGDQPFFDYPRILGHELGVEVMKVGDQVTNVKQGDRCTIEPYRQTHLGDQAVFRGKPNCAEHLSVLGVHEDGGMQEFFTFPARYLHSSDQLSYDSLAMIEPLGIGCHAVNRATVSPDDRVLVIGAGPIGLGTIHFSLAAGASVAVMEIDSWRNDFADRHFDLLGTVNPKEKEFESQLRELFNGELPTIVFDATGNKQSMERAFDFVAHGGKLVYIGLVQDDITFHNPDFHKKELTLLSSRNALSSDFKQIMDAMERGEIDPTFWITHRCSFDDLITQFEHWTKPATKVVKAIIELN